MVGGGKNKTRVYEILLQRTFRCVPSCQASFLWKYWNTSRERYRRNRNNATGVRLRNAFSRYCYLIALWPTAEQSWSIFEWYEFCQYRLLFNPIVVFLLPPGPPSTIETVHPSAVNRNRITGERKAKYYFLYKQNSWDSRTNQRICRRLAPGTLANSAAIIIVATNSSVAVKCFPEYRKTFFAQK